MIKEENMFNKKEDQKEYKKTCMSPTHNPPTHIYLTPGEHEWICEACGTVQIIVVPCVMY
ncbi:MAG: hypothetical protein M0P12_00160 [Paludibacteraceae bacterium]|jgi:hypothetical protein|nr:hypothetical protein [Paludibacteraceae bacterium]MCK9615575.1 hypothetical protein [Candidatus Omnitrophota bacterium]